jgi:hypothetical protein
MHHPRFIAAGDVFLKEPVTELVEVMGLIPQP